MNIINTRYVISVDGQTAFIEAAAVIGLPLVPPDRLNPLYTTTFGLGKVIFDALERGCREFVIGLGGSATNDAGLGMLQALGYRFLDRQGAPVGRGGIELDKVAAIDGSGVHPALKESRFITICDVTNPFCGPNGAAYIFAPQKGATPEMVRTLDRGMASLAQVIKQTQSIDITNVDGAGAAGGLGGIFLSFLNAKLQRGIDWILNYVDFDQKIIQANIVITGEGRADRQTLMGKAPFGVLTAAQKQHIPVILIAGAVQNRDDLLAAGFDDLFPIHSTNLPLKEAMNPQTTKQQIRQTVQQVIRNYLSLK
jgi:glycerate kinase